MKKITILIAFLFIAVTTQGQIKFGVSGGINFSYVTPETIAVGDRTVSTIDDRSTGFHIGVLSRISLPGLFIQPELLYTSIGNDMSITGEVPYSRKINRLDLPVLVGRKLGLLHLGIGPVGSIIVGESSGLDIEDKNIKEEYNDMIFGLQAGIGVNISNLVVDLKYERGLTSLGDEITINNDTGILDSRAHQFIISLGILL